VSNVNSRNYLTLTVARQLILTLKREVGIIIVNFSVWVISTYSPHSFTWDETPNTALLVSSFNTSCFSL